MGRRAPLMLPGVVMSCMRMAGCCLCCARARHAEVARSRRKQRRDVSSVLGQRAGRGRRIGAVCERRRAVPGRAVPRAHDRRVGRWRGHVRNRKSWVVSTPNYTWYGKVTPLPFDWYRNGALPWPGRSSAGQVWCPKSRTIADRPTRPSNGTVTYETVMKPS